MILTASRKIRGVGILCAGGRWRRLPPPFAGQAGFVAEDVDADPDRHPHATTSTSFSLPRVWFGLLVGLNQLESGHDDLDLGSRDLECQPVHGPSLASVTGLAHTKS